MDILNDTSNMQLLEISDRYDVPSYVLNSVPLEKSAAEQLPTELFADQALRQFPIDSKASTWLSAAFFNENEEKMASGLRDHVKQMILKAAAIYNIDQDVKDVFSSEKKAEIVENRTIYCYTDDNGGRHYPISGPNGVKRACDYFENHFREYEAGKRHEIAKGIAKVAMDMGVEPSRTVMIEGGFGIVDRVALHDEILERMKMTKDAEAAALLGNLSELLSVADAKELDRETVKVAEIMDCIDALNGMDNHKYWSPLQAICPMTVKEAKAMVDRSVDLDGLVFDSVKLAEKVDPQIFVDVLGEEFTKELFDGSGRFDAEKIAEIVPTLPLPDKRLLAKHIVANCEA